MTAHLCLHPDKTAEIFWPNQFQLNLKGNLNIRSNAIIHMEDEETMHDNLLQNLIKFDREVTNNFYRLNAIYVYIKTVDGVKNLRFTECSFITTRSHMKYAELPRVGAETIQMRNEEGWEIDIDFHFMTWAVLREDQK